MNSINDLAVFVKRARRVNAKKGVLKYSEQPEKRAVKKGEKQSEKKSKGVYRYFMRMGGVRTGAVYRVRSNSLRLFKRQKRHGKHDYRLRTARRQRPDARVYVAGKRERFYVLVSIPLQQKTHFKTV